MKVFVARRAAFAISGPNVMLGTKRPSMTSTWKRSTPTASASFMWSLRRVKSAERIDADTSTLLMVNVGNYAAHASALQRFLPRKARTGLEVVGGGAAGAGAAAAAGTGAGRGGGGSGTIGPGFLRNTAHTPDWAT